MGLEPPRVEAQSQSGVTQISPLGNLYAQMVSSSGLIIVFIVRVVRIVLLEATQKILSSLEL